MKIKAYFESSGVYATGLSPTLNIRDIADGSLAVEGLDMTEVGDGFYVYDFPAYDYSVIYAILCDGTSTLADDDRYVEGEFMFGEVVSTVAGGASVVGLVNQALYMLGQKSIISMTEDNEAARLCNGRYGYIRDSVIRAYPWNCAMARASLAKSSTAPTWKFNYKYALPTDPYCLRVLSMEEEEESGYKWKVLGRFVETDAATCYVMFLARLTDVNEMDLLLREAIAARLAADICYALTGSSKQQERMWTLYEQKVRRAKSADAQEGTPDVIMHDTFLDARL